MVSILNELLQFTQSISSGLGIAMLSKPIILTLSAICLPFRKLPEHPSCMFLPLLMVVESEKTHRPAIFNFYT